MSFWGHSFSFNGIPCEDFQLMMYSIDGISHSDGKFASVSIIEEDNPSHWKPYFYGTKFEEKLSFTIVFGVDQDRIDEQRYLTRDELEGVAAWLIGHDRYLWLEIHQEDMEYVRYKCIVTNLEIVEFETIPWALKATFVCDSPFAYMYPQTFEYTVSGRTDIVLYNESSHNGFYMPLIEFYFDESRSLQIKNNSDPNGTPLDCNFPSSVSHVTVDNENCLVSTNDEDVNPYEYINYGFLRLVRGYNNLEIHGSGILYITCEFPVNIGG